jgi:hypothetical protein
LRLGADEIMTWKPNGWWPTLLQLQLSTDPEPFFPDYHFPRPGPGEMDWKRLKWQLSTDPINECIDHEKRPGNSP